MPSSPIKIALVGCGVWGKNHARNLHNLGVLSCIIDPNGAELAKFYHVDWFPTLPDLLQASSSPKLTPDALIIAAPDIQHFTLANMALEANLDLFIEKPLAMNFPQAKDLCAQAEAKNRILMVGHLLRYHPAFECLLKAANSGMIGTLEQIISIRHDVFTTPRDYDLIWGYGPHDASMIMALAGDDSLISSGFYGDASQECLLVGGFASGLQITISLSWQTPKRRLLMVKGTQGQLIFDDAKADGCKISVLQSSEQFSGQSAEILPYANTEPLKCELEHFIRSLQSRTQPRTGTYEALKTMQLLDSCAKFAKSYQKI